jgi:hypothetical protein
MELPATHKNEDLWTNLSPTAPPLDYLQLYKDGLLPQASHEQLLAEVQLLSLGDYFPLNIWIDVKKLSEELSAYDGKWRPYLQREGRVNNREGLCLVGLEGDTPFDSFSIPEARKRTGRPLMDRDFTAPTELYRHCRSLHPLLEYFSPLGRTMFVKCNEGGWFAPHRDGKWIFRDCFRLIVFCKNCGHENYDWYMNNQKLRLEEGRVYYINTRLQHKTVSYTNDSIHLIMNVPVTLENVLKLLTYA